jgi:hypothetical protein
MNASRASVREAQDRADNDSFTHRNTTSQSSERAAVKYPDIICNIACCIHIGDQQEANQWIKIECIWGAQLFIGMLQYHRLGQM